MFDFNGNAAGGGKVNLGGHGRNRTRGAGAEESRSDFVKRQHKEREAREKRRIRDRAATKIQAAYRGHRCLLAKRAEWRQVFDKRYADMVKVGAVLPVEKKAKFVFHALLPMLRLFAFFFTYPEDEKRLSGILDFVMFSAGQPQACNICHLILSSDDGQRRSILALLEKLLAALLRGGHAQEAAKLLLGMQAALAEPANAVGSARAIGQLLRRTQVLESFTHALFPRLTDPATPVVPGQISLLELAELCVAGAEACAPPVQQQLIACLLSAPRLGERLCEESTASAGVPSTLASQKCLQRLVGLLADLKVEVALQALPEQEIEGLPRWEWLLCSLLSILERFVQTGGGSSHLSACLDWICKVREQRPPGALPGSTSRAQLDRLQRPGFVRALLQTMDRQNTEGLIAVCRLYFADGEAEPPAEFLQTLAFATPLAERLFPTLVDLMRNSDAEAAFNPALVTPEALRLRVFCAVYALQLQPMYDFEFFGSANPLSLQEVECLAPFLNRLAYKFVTTWPDVRVLKPGAKALRESLTSLLSALINRHRRRPILHGSNAWVIQNSRLLLRRSAGVVDLGGGEDEEDEPMPTAEASSPNLEDDRMDVEEAHPASSSTSTPGVGGRLEDYTASQVLEAVLEEIPHVLPFEDRVSLLHNVISADQEKRRDSRSPWAPMMNRRQIRRNFLVEDAFNAFEEMTDGDGLRDVFRVEFIAPDGSPESGVDGGGLFKEFLITVGRAMFDPDFGLFTSTSDQTLYPAVSAFKNHERALDLYCFLGKLVGKGIYEMVLLEPQFCRVFLNRLLGRINEADDVAALDKELHRNMLQIKESTNIEELNLTFSVTVSEGGYFEEIDLVPNGRNVPVTKDNLIRYFHLMAHYKTNVQFERQRVAFLRGLGCVVPLSWLKMFDPYELNSLISGSIAGFDVGDLRQHTVYYGGYRDDSPVVTWLWQLLQSMDPEDMGRFLMFVTSCSRAPLLGFKTMYPQFCVHRVPDSHRLPTASTCANLLKLPDYSTFEILKSKVMQAIRSEAGFDLS